MEKKLMDHGGKIIAILLDFNRAFVTIDTEILNHKLYNCGVMDENDGLNHT